MGVNFAVFGDIHGRQDSMYECAIEWEKESNRAIDAVLQLGDFETIRGDSDFSHYYAPKKYHHISDFSEYYSGLKEAPFLTVFIGGNHEAWGVLKKHNSGGFVAPNIYYLGRAGVLNVKGVSIGGLTGVYSPKRYRSPLSKEPCHDWKYYREEDVKALEDKKIDILLLHDWVRPVSGIEIDKERNIPANLKQNSSAHSPSLELVTKTQPKYVLMGHVHKACLEGRLNNMKIVALSEFDKQNPDSFRIISYEI